jgi:hypothetical protein
MRAKITLSTIGVVAALGAGGIVATGASASSAATSAPTRHVEGRVVAINRPAGTFTVRDAERGTLKVKITSSTRFERIAGFSALHMSERVDVRASGGNGSWSATAVQRGVRDAADNGVGDEHHQGADDGVNHHPGADDGVNHLEPNDR